MGVVVGSCATFKDISTGLLVLVSVTGTTTSRISFTSVFSIIGDKSVAFITATLSANSDLLFCCK